MGSGKISNLNLKNHGVSIDHNRCSKKFIWISGDDTISLVHNSCKIVQRYDDFWYYNFENSDISGEDNGPEKFEPISVSYSETLNNFYGLIKKSDDLFYLRIMNVEDKILSGELEEGMNQGENLTDAIEISMKELSPEGKKIISIYFLFFFSLIFF